MKSLSILMTILMGQLCFGASQVLVPVDNVYTPKGFDSNDNAEVIVSGYFPNLCYRNVTSKLIREGDILNINVMGTKVKRQFCAEAVVPFLEVVDLGVLPADEYKVRVNQGSRTTLFDDIKIVSARQGRIDEYNHPMVSSIDYNSVTGELSIKGHIPSDCFEITGVEFYSDQKNLITVLPKMVQKRDFCPRKLQPIKLERKVPNLVNSLQTLIHVRSLNQKSRNIEVML